MDRVKVTNMTSLFSKDMLIYSFFDIRLKRPVRVARMLYFAVLFLIMGLPLIILTWPVNVYKLAFAVGVPYGLASLMSKPIWNGKSFLSFMKTQIRFMRRPKKLYDWRGRSHKDTYRLDSNITVSRHKDYEKLYELKVKEMET